MIALSDRRRAAIVGGGPSGLLMAVYLAQMNWSVSIYERRVPPELEIGSKGGRRSYNLVLTARGLQALKNADIILPEEIAVVLKGNVRHRIKGSKLSRQFREAVAVNRDRLAQYLVSEGQRRHPEHIDYCFEHTLQTIDFQEHKLGFFKDQTTISATYDLLIGADGVFSTVRTLIDEQFELFRYQQNRDSMTFKVCELGSATALPDAAEDWGACFHTWPEDSSAPLLAPPNPDGTLTGVLILPAQGHLTFAEIQAPEQVQSMFERKFPNIRYENLPENFAQDLLDQKTAYGGITTTCSTFHIAGSVVLLGDAAHSVWPSLGQGCNAALESCAALANRLTEHDDLTQALEAYTVRRKPDVDAVARLSETGFGGNKRAGNALFFAQVAGVLLLNKLLPQLIDKPALFKIGDPNMPYAQIEQETRRQKILLGITIAILLILLTLTSQGIISMI